MFFFQLRIGVAWLVVLLTTCNVSTAVAESLTYNEWQQVSRLSKYISSVDSKEDSNCKLQYECSRCLETTEKSLDDLHHCTVGDGKNDFFFFKRLGWVSYMKIVLQKTLATN